MNTNLRNETAGGDGRDPDGSQQLFERVFEREDPWHYSSAYEQQKYARQLQLFPDRPIARGLELGCAEGHFTLQMAARVGALVATDISATALQRATARCAAFTNIQFQQLDYSVGQIPGDMDLIVCSESLYYLPDEAALGRLAPIIAAALRPGGWLLMAHGRTVGDDMTRTGFDWETAFGAEIIHKVFSALPELALERSFDTELYRIDRFRRIAAGEPAVPAVIETGPLAPLEPDVARSVIWGGAKLLRSQAKLHEQRRSLPILLYHGVSETRPEASAHDRVTPALFHAQMRWLRANGFYSISSAALLAQIETGENFAGRPILLTFDDGFPDFVNHAEAILLAHDFTAEQVLVSRPAGMAAARLDMHPLNLPCMEVMGDGTLEDFIAMIEAVL